ncbi:glutathione synthase [Desulfatitalea tepidiphila]|uniref:glutathione synthase n=1 Tax=Desulfatitalea tepidiphila TaxID=1185843 RepID=UPI0006B52E4B|nr:glutathione synthase [Desulfatitalea tepidiphila]
MIIAFLMDKLETIDPSFETTSHLMYECNQRGHKVFFLEPHDVYIRGNEVVARMRDITVPPDMPLKAYWQALIACLQKEELIFESITDLDVLFLRKDPPLNYQTLEFLQPVNRKVFMINNTIGQIMGNSKLYTLNFPDIIPDTHVSRDPKRLIKLIENFGGAMVVKPLQRFGGEGVIKVSTRDRENLISLINYYTQASRQYAEREPIMVQEYLEAGQRDGDVRILLLNGDILGAMRRVPQAGEFRSNVKAGGKVMRHDITPQDVQICERIKPRLIADGLYFVGIDVIGDKLIEVNCVSPGGIPRINALNGVQIEAQVIDFVEQKALEHKRQNDARAVHA